MGVKGLYLVPSDPANLEFFSLWGLGCPTQTNLYWAIRALCCRGETCTLAPAVDGAEARPARARRALWLCWGTSADSRGTGVGCAVLGAGGANAATLL